jgi:hypothetical protein
VAKKNSIVIEIKGNHYEFILQSPQTYKRNHGSDSAAITYVKDKKVFFRTDEFNNNTIRHEIAHILFAESHTGSSDLSPDQVEEVFCEIIAEMYSQIQQICDKIVSALN